jgi:hypothetical protein
MHGIDNYIPETNNVYTVHSAAAVQCLQSVLHVMLFRTWNVFCTVTSAHPAVFAQFPIWLVFGGSLNSCFTCYVAQALSE